MSNAVKFDFPVTDITYKVIGHRKLKLYIFEPKTSDRNRACILFFIGGSFKKNPYRTPAHFQHQANYLSSQGIVAICVDYRTGRDEGFTPIQAIVDAKSAVRWVRKHSLKLGINPDKIVMCGSSAGGYISVSSIMFQDLNDDGAYDNQNKDHIPNALIIFGSGMDGIDIMRRRYPELLERAKYLSPIHNMQKCLPPTLWLCGTKEATPNKEGELYEQNKAFVKQMIVEGNDITFEAYEGMEHGFFHHGRHGNKYFYKTMLRVEEYLKSLQFI